MKFITITLMLLGVLNLASCSSNENQTSESSNESRETRTSHSKDLDSLNYFSTVLLNRDEHQLLLASQNYNTNYAIYASFKTRPSETNKNRRILDSVNFKIINYKPTIFIGIKNIELIMPTKKRPLGFRIYVQGLLEEPTYSLEISNNQNLPQIEIANKSFIKSERVLVPLFPEVGSQITYENLRTGKIKCNEDNGKVFDSEFFFKDGSHVIGKYNYDEDPDNRAPKNIDQENLNAMFLPGSARCKDALNYVIFSP